MEKDERREKREKGERDEREGERRRCPLNNSVLQRYSPTVLSNSFYLTYLSVGDGGVGEGEDEGYGGGLEKRVLPLLVRTGTKKKL